MTEHTDMNASSGAGISPCTHGTRGKGTMSTYAQHEHGEETEKLQADAAEHKPTRHSAVTSPSPAQIKR